MTSNDMSGTVRDLTGRMKEGYGAITGDNAKKFEGEINQASGKMQQQAGQIADGAAEAASTAAARASAVLRNAAGVVVDEAHVVGTRIYAAGAKANAVVGETIVKAPLLSLIGMAALGYLSAFLIHAASSPLAPEPKVQRWLRR